MNKSDLLSNIDGTCPMCRTVFKFIDIFTEQSMELYYSKDDQKLFNFIKNKYFKKNKVTQFEEETEVSANNCSKHICVNILMVTAILIIIVVILSVSISSLKMNKK
jgi:hypothetical protein